MQYCRNHTKSTTFLIEFGCTVNIVFSENTKYHDHDISNKEGGGSGGGRGINRVIELKSANLNILQRTDVLTQKTLNL